MEENEAFVMLDGVLFKKESDSLGGGFLGGGGAELIHLSSLISWKNLQNGRLVKKFKLF